MAQGLAEFIQLLGLQDAVGCPQGHHPFAAIGVVAIDGSTVFDNEWIAQFSVLAKGSDLLSGFAGAGDHQNPLLFECGHGAARRLPAVAVIQQRAVEIGDHPARHQPSSSQCTANGSNSR